MDFDFKVDYYHKDYMIVQVEVLDWMGEDISPNNDGSIEKIQIVEGEGYTTPNEGAIVDGKWI